MAHSSPMRPPHTTASTNTAFQAGDGPPQPLLSVPAWHRAVRHCRAGQCPERPYGTAHGVPAEPRGCAQTPDTNHSQNKAGCGFLPALPPCPGGCAVTADTSERCIASSPEAAPQGSLSVPFPCRYKPIGTPPGPTAVGADAARSPRSAFRVVGAGGGDGSAAPAGADSTELRQHGQPCTLHPGPAGQPSPNQQRDTELLPCPAGMGAMCDSTAAIPPPWQSPLLLPPARNGARMVQNPGGNPAAPVSFSFTTPYGEPHPESILRLSH